MERVLEVDLGMFQTVLGFWYDVLRGEYGRDDDLIQDQRRGYGTGVDLVDRLRIGRFRVQRNACVRFGRRSF